MATEYLHKPTVVEAMQLMDTSSAMEIQGWVHNSKLKLYDCYLESVPTKISIGEKTDSFEHQQLQVANLGDWVVLDSFGEFSVIARKTFFEKYYPKGTR